MGNVASSRSALGAINGWGSPRIRTESRVGALPLDTVRWVVYRGDYSTSLLM